MGIGCAATKPKGAECRFGGVLDGKRNWFGQEVKLGRKSTKCSGFLFNKKTEQKRQFFGEIIKNKFGFVQPKKLVET